MDADTPVVPRGFCLTVAWDTRDIAIVDVDHSDANPILKTYIDHQHPTAYFDSISQHLLKCFYRFEGDMGNSQNIVLVGLPSGKKPVIEIQHGLWSCMDTRELIQNGNLDIPTIEFDDFYNYLFDKMGNEFYVWNKPSTPPTPPSRPPSRSPSIVSDASTRTCMAHFDAFMHTRDQIQQLLECISPSTMENYDEWLKIGMILHGWSQGSLEGFELWRSVSSMAVDKFQENEWQDGGLIYRTKWQSFGSGTPNGMLTVGTLRFFARRDNPDLYSTISLKKNDGSFIIDNCNHASLARFLYDNHPHVRGYIYFCPTEKKWIVCHPTNHRWDVFDNPTTIHDDMSEFLLQFVSAEDHDLMELFDMIRRDDAHINPIVVAFYKSRPDLNPSNIHSYFKNQKRKIEKCKTSICSFPFMDSVLKCLKTLVYDTKIMSKLDKQYHLFPFEDAVFDTRTFQIHPIMPYHFISKHSTGYTILDYQSDTVLRKKLDEFLSSFFVSPAQKLNALQLIASSIAGRNFLQLFGVWVGHGCNGKSTMIDVLKVVFGTMAVVMPSSILTNQSSSKNETSALVHTEGVRMLFISEPEDKRRFMASELKSWTGDGLIRVRGLYQESKEIQPTFVPHIITNDMIELNSMDEAMNRRLHPIHFKKKFVSATHDLTDNDESDMIVVRTDEMDAKLQAIKTETAYRQEFALLLMEIYEGMDKTGLPNVPENLELLSEIMETNNAPIVRIVDALFTITEDENDKMKLSDIRNHIVEYIEDNRHMCHVKIKSVMDYIQKKLNQTPRPIRVDGIVARAYTSIKPRETTYCPGMIPL
jgi:phage/plasmid-associated DNA primase